MPSPPSPPTLARFDGWRVVAAAALLQALGIGLLPAYGFVATPLIEEFGASTVQLGLGFSISILFAALTAPPLGWLLDRRPLRPTMLFGVALMAGATVALSRGRSLAELAACFGLATVGMSAYGFFPAQVMVVNWFLVRRGTALALAAAGLSVSTFLVPQITSRLIDGLGWRLAVAILGCGAAALAVPVIAFFAVKRPEDVGQHPDGLPPTKHAGAAPPLVELPITNLLRDPRFWLIGIGSGLALCVAIPGFFLIRHMEELGISRVEAANVPSLMALCGLVGKLLAGWSIDRIDKRIVVTIALGLHGLGWVIAATQSTLHAFLLAAVPLGLGGGGFLPLPAVLLGGCFGRAMIGRVSGMQGLLQLPLLLAITPLAGWLEQQTGSFAAPFLLLAALLGVAAATLFFVRVETAEPA